MLKPLYQRIHKICMHVIETVCITLIVVCTFGRKEISDCV